MYPILFEVFGRPIATYGTFMIIAAFAAWLLVRFLGGNKDRHIPMSFLMCICGGLVGLVMLRPITRIPEIIINWDSFKQIPFEMMISFLFGEMVFYGGLIGGVIALLIYCRGYKVPVLPMADLFAPGMALAHGFGRVGCFFAGCCYGVHTDASHPFAVVFPETGLGIVPHGEPLLAVQLIEAACLFVLAAVLSIVYKKTGGKGFTICLYGIIYSILRFILEFFRGDPIRGIYGPFSTSQYISIAIFITCTILMYLAIQRAGDKENLNKIKD